MTRTKSLYVKRYPMPSRLASSFREGIKYYNRFKIYIYKYNYIIINISINCINYHNITNFVDFLILKMYLHDKIYWNKLFMFMCQKFLHRDLLGRLLLRLHHRSLTLACQGFKACQCCHRENIAMLGSPFKVHYNVHIVQPQSWNMEIGLTDPKK